MTQSSLTLASIIRWGGSTGRRGAELGHREAGRCPLLLLRCPRSGTSRTPRAHVQLIHFVPRAPPQLRETSAHALPQDGPPLRGVPACSLNATPNPHFNHTLRRFSAHFFIALLFLLFVCLLLFFSYYFTMSDFLQNDKGNLTSGQKKSIQRIFLLGYGGDFPYFCNLKKDKATATNMQRM